MASLYAGTHPERVRQLVLWEPMPLTADDMDKLWNTLVEFSYLNGHWNDMARHARAISPKDHEQIDYQAMMMLRNTMTNYHCDADNPPEWPIWRVGGYMASKQD